MAKKKKNQHQIHLVESSLIVIIVLCGLQLSAVELFVLLDLKCVHVFMRVEQEHTHVHNK